MALSSLGGLAATILGNPLTQAGLGIGASALLGGGGGGGGGLNFGSANLSTPFLEELFGVRFEVSDSGKVRLRPFNKKKSIFARQGRGNRVQGIFGPEQKRAIADFLTPLPLSPTETAALGLAEGGIPSAEAALELLGPASGTFRDLLETGIPTDIGAIRDLALRRLTRETIPQLAEQFSGITGTFGTDFTGQVAQSASDVEAELAALEAELQEAATGRRAAASVAAPAFITGTAGAPIGVASDLFNFGTAARQAEEQTRPGARILPIFSGLSGLAAPSNTGPFLQGAQPSGFSTALGALSQVAGAFPAAKDLGGILLGGGGDLLDALKGVFSGGGGGGSLPGTISV